MVQKIFDASRYVHNCQNELVELVNCVVGDVARCSCGLLFVAAHVYRGTASWTAIEPHDAILHIQKVARIPNEDDAIEFLRQ